MAKYREFFINNFNKGEFGLEQEGLRVTPSGEIAQTAHPFPGDKRIDRDFCENQIEMITGVFHSVDQLVHGMAALKGETAKGLLRLDSGKEYLWPFSSPPAVPTEDEIPIAEFRGELREKTIYRNYLAEKYGKWIMLYSGIHFNFSFPDELIRSLWETKPRLEYQKFKDQVYLNLGKNVIQYSWLIVYLTAASPILDPAFGGCSPENIEKYASPRCSEIGYWNEFIPTLDFSNVDAYVDSIEKYISKGELSASSELYYPVRFKPRGSNDLDVLREKGINHIELRMLDVNPLSPSGVNRQDLYFIYLLIIYLTAKDKSRYDCEFVDAIVNMKNASLFDVDNVEIHMNSRKENIRTLALEILDSMAELFEDLHEDVSDCLNYQREKILDHSKRYATIIKSTYQSDYMTKGMELAVKNTEALLKMTE